MTFVDDVVQFLLRVPGMLPPHLAENLIFRAGLNSSLAAAIFRVCGWQTKARKQRDDPLAELTPPCFILVELVNQALRPPLARGQIGIMIRWVWIFHIVREVRERVQAGPVLRRNGSHRKQAAHRIPWRPPRSRCHWWGSGFRPSIID